MSDLWRRSAGCGWCGGTKVHERTCQGHPDSPHYYLAKRLKASANPVERTVLRRQLKEAQAAARRNGA